MIKIKLDNCDKAVRIDKLLCQKFDISFALVQKIIREKKVKLNINRAQASDKVKSGDLITINAELPIRKISLKKRKTINSQQQKKFDSWIIYEDENLLAINKPSGLATQGGSNIKISVDDFVKNKNWKLVHRLDKDTSGILLIAKNNQIADFFYQNFKKNNISKSYLALINGHVKKNELLIDIPLRKKLEGNSEKIVADLSDGKNAITKFKLLKKFNDYCLVELKPITGRTHQLRVHMKEIGHPIINDIKYGGKKVANKKPSPRLCLHAHQITIKKYLNNQKLTITCPDPDFVTNPS